MYKYLARNISETSTAGAAFGTYTVYLYDDAASNWVWSDPVSGKFYVSANVGVPIKIGLAPTIYPSGFLYNDKDIYSATGPWYDSASAKWIISIAVGYGQTPDLSWYSCSTLVGTYLKQGTATVNRTVTAPQLITREKSGVGPAGVYTPTSGSGLTGDIWVGFRWLKENAFDAWQQEPAEYNGKATFYSTVWQRYLWWDTTNWIISAVIGTADPAVGYWTGADLIGVEFSRTYTGGTPPDPESYTLSEYQYLIAHTPTAYNPVQLIAEVPIWI